MAQSPEVKKTDVRCKQCGRLFFKIKEGGGYKKIEIGCPKCGRRVTLE